MGRFRALVVGSGGGCHDTESTQNFMPGYADDARQFAAFLAGDYAIPERDIRLLVNAAANRRSVVSGLNWLLTDVGPADRCVLYFSGLGHRVPAGGTLREVLTLHDGSFLYDNEIAFLTRQLPPHTVSLVLDTGFQGGFDQQFGAPDQVAVKAWRAGYTPEQLRVYKQRFARISAFKPFGCEPLACTSREALELTMGSCTISKERASALNAVLVKAGSDWDSVRAGHRRTAGLSVFTFGLCSALRQTGIMVSSTAAASAAGEVVAALGAQQSPQHIYPASWTPADGFSFLAQSELSGWKRTQRSSRSSAATANSVWSGLRRFAREVSNRRALDTEGAGGPLVIHATSAELVMKFGLTPSSR